MALFPTHHHPLALPWGGVLEFQQSSVLKGVGSTGSAGLEVKGPECSRPSPEAFGQATLLSGS